MHIAQRPIQITVKYLRWCVFEKVVDGFELLAVFPKRSILDV